MHAQDSGHGYAWRLNFVLLEILLNIGVGNLSFV
jgi:hypothetical protein